MTAHRPQSAHRKTVPTSAQSLAWQESNGATPCFKRKPFSATQALMEAPPGVEPEESTEDDETGIGGPATEALASLPELHRECFALTHLGGMSYSEAAKQLGVSKTRCFTIAKEAKQLLIEALEGQ